MFFWCRTSKTEPALVFSMFTAAPVVCLRPHGNSWGQWDALYGINIRRGVMQPIGFLCLRRQVKAFSGHVRSLSWLSLRAFSRICHLLSSGMVPLRCALQLPKAKPEQNVYFDRYVFRKNGDFFWKKKKTRWNSSFVTFYVTKQVGRSAHVEVREGNLQQRRTTESRKWKECVRGLPERGHTWLTDKQRK